MAPGGRGRPTLHVAPPDCAAEAVDSIVGPEGEDEDAARVQSTLLHLLEADWRCMQRTEWPWDASYYFDFDGVWPSSVVARSE